MATGHGAGAGGMVARPDPTAPPTPIGTRAHHAVHSPRVLGALDRISRAVQSALARTQLTEADAAAQPAAQRATGEEDSPVYVAPARQATQFRVE